MFAQKRNCSNKWEKKYLLTLTSYNMTVPVEMSFTKTVLNPQVTISSVGSMARYCAKEN